MKMKYDDSTIAKVLIAFLVEEKSHRWIQREILDLPAPPKGGGFRVMEILHNFNIKGKDKGLLKNNINNIENINEKAITLISDYIEQFNEIENNIDSKSNETEKLYIVKSRLCQYKLKNSALKSYNNTCALCDIDQPELLVASHIIPWKDSKEKRLDSDNCILLCSFHDKLFDKGFITLDENYCIIVSAKLSITVSKYLDKLSFRIPKIDPPNIDNLMYHREKIFKK